MRQKHWKRRHRMKMDPQATSRQQCPSHQKRHHSRKAEMEGDGIPGEGGRGRENVSEESQDKSVA